MYIDLHPPEFPQKGDVWIRLGEWRVWEGGWVPPLIPERRRGRRRGRTMRVEVKAEG